MQRQLYLLCQDKKVYIYPFDTWRECVRGDKKIPNTNIYIKDHLVKRIKDEIDSPFSLPTISMESQKKFLENLHNTKKVIATVVQSQIPAPNQNKIIWSRYDDNTKFNGKSDEYDRVLNQLIMDLKKYTFEIDKTHNSAALFVKYKDFFLRIKAEDKKKLIEEFFNAGVKNLTNINFITKLLS